MEGGALLLGGRNFLGMRRGWRVRDEGKDVGMRQGGTWG
jgi:hypothetical protein